MTEPSTSFWDDWDRHLEMAELEHQREHDAHRAICNKMTPEEREAALANALDHIYSNHPDKDPRNRP